MRLDPDGTLVLSRRNLQTLLAKLDDPSSPATLQGGNADGRGAWGRQVRAESDHEHYGAGPAGEVHPDHDPGRDDGGPVL